MLVALVGCDYALRIDEVPFDGKRDSHPGNCTVSSETFAPVSCASTAFSATPTDVAELAGDISGDPSIRGDELEIFYTRQGAQQYSIGYATRPTVTSYWQLRGVVPFVDPSARELDPSVSADGSYVAFVSNRAGTEDHVYLAHRECDTWDVMPAPGLEGTAVSTLELSFDALALYFSTPALDIYEVRRTSTVEPFGTPLLVVQNGEWPGVSSDELEIYFTRPGVNGIQRATRTTTGVAFDTSTSATQFGGDPDLTPDGRTLYTYSSSAGTVKVTRRLCP